jgi:hypothetical protein
MEREYAEKTLRKWEIWEFDTLKQVKQVLKLSASNPKGRVIWQAIQAEDDCFGRDYDAESEECRRCTVQVSVGGLIDELRLVCAAVVWLLRLKKGDAAQPNKCSCGCGKPVKPGQRYIKGHFWRNRHFTQEHKDKLRLSLTRN